MAITTDSKEATLVARFDLLFTDEMKAYVKAKGGAGYIRDLVLRDILRQLTNVGLSLSEEDSHAMQQALQAESRRY